MAWPKNSFGFFHDSVLKKPEQMFWPTQLTLVVKNLPANAGNIRDMSSIPGPGRSPEGGHGSPLQYSYLENPVDRGAWWATVHRVTKSWTRLSMHAIFHLKRENHSLSCFHFVPLPVSQHIILCERYRLF